MVCFRSYGSSCLNKTQDVPTISSRPLPQNSGTRSNPNVADRLDDESYPASGSSSPEQGQHAKAKPESDPPTRLQPTRGWCQRSLSKRSGRRSSFQFNVHSPHRTRGPVYQPQRVLVCRLRFGIEIPKREGNHASLEIDYSYKEEATWSTFLPAIPHNFPYSPMSLPLPRLLPTQGFILKVALPTSRSSRTTLTRSKILNTSPHRHLLPGLRPPFLRPLDAVASHFASNSKPSKEKTRAESSTFKTLFV